MYKTSKWIPITVLFLILLLGSLLLFAMLGQHANADGTGGDGTTTAPTGTSEPSGTSEPTTPSSTTNPTSTQSSDQTSTGTQETPPPSIDLAGKFPLYDKDGKLLGEVTVEEYLCGALLGCLSFTYEPAALETQAIALRTDTYARLSAGGALSTATYGYTDREALLPVWGADFTTTIWERAVAAVNATKGQVLKSGDSLYSFAVTGEHGVLLAETDVGKRAKSSTTAELLAYFYPSATLVGGA